jgi:hypothetical protein
MSSITLYSSVLICTQLIFTIHAPFLSLYSQLLKPPGFSTSLCSRDSAATIFLYDELRTLSLTYIAEGPTSTNSKHISHDPYPVLLCDVTAHVQLMDMQETHVT